MPANDQAPVPAPRYVGFDLETTGVDPFTDVPVSYGFVEFSATGPRIKSGYINPGIAIPEAVTSIHGITDADVASAPSLIEATEFLAKSLSSIWAGGGVLVGMNVAYDLTMVESLTQRLGLKSLSERGEIGPVVDILILDRRLDKWRKGGRKLTDLCAHYGVEISNAHDAVADVEASLKVLDAILARYTVLAALTPETINTTLRAWYVEWLTDFSSYLVKKGDTAPALGRYQWPIHTNE